MSAFLGNGTLKNENPKVGAGSRFHEPGNPYWLLTKWQKRYVQTSACSTTHKKRVFRCVRVLWELNPKEQNRIRNKMFSNFYTHCQASFITKQNEVYEYVLCTDFVKILNLKKHKQVNIQKKLKSKFFSNILTLNRLRSDIILNFVQYSFLNKRQLLLKNVGYSIWFHL